MFNFRHFLIFKQKRLILILFYISKILFVGTWYLLLKLIIVCKNDNKQLLIIVNLIDYRINNIDINNI